jgi:hypothetical protein
MKRLTLRSKDYKEGVEGIGLFIPMDDGRRLCLELGIEGAEKLHAALRSFFVERAMKKVRPEDLECD